MNGVRLLICRQLTLPDYLCLVCRQLTLPDYLCLVSQAKQNLLSGSVLEFTGTHLHLVDYTYKTPETCDEEGLLVQHLSLVPYVHDTLMQLGDYVFSF